MITSRFCAMIGALALIAGLSVATAAQGIDPKSLPEQIKDAPLDEARAELIEIAFASATEMPANPHIKTRSRFQHKVVILCLELDQAKRALRYAEAIDNWRRGEAFAQIARYCVEHGAKHEQVQGFLDIAMQWSTHQMKGTVRQEWRVDRVKVAIAQVHELLGNAAEAAKLEKGVVDSEAGKVDVIRARRVTDETFEKQLAMIDATIATGGFDRARNALAVCAALYEQSYGNKERRKKLSTRITKGFEKLPLLVRIELLESLAESAIKREDKDEALTHVAAILEVIEGHRWMARDELPLLARTANLEYRAGAKEAAAKRVASLLKRFDKERGKILNFNRASVLRPIAEAYQVMGQAGQAIRIYKQAVEEGALNPNSRPRCKDLVETCCSLARHDVAVDAFLHDRLTTLRGALGNPW